MKLQQLTTNTISDHINNSNSLQRLKARKKSAENLINKLDREAS